jgi:hypothetical protein
MLSKAGALEAFKVAKEIAAHGATVTTFSDWWNYKMEVVDAIPFNAGMLSKAGVLTSLNSDDAELMRHLNMEAAKMACLWEVGQALSPARCRLPWQVRRVGQPVSLCPLYPPAFWEVGQALSPARCRLPWQVRLVRQPIPLCPLYPPAFWEARQALSPARCRLPGR